MRILSSSVPLLVATIVSTSEKAIAFTGPSAPVQQIQSKSKSRSTSRLCDSFLEDNVIINANIQKHLCLDSRNTGTGSKYSSNHGSVSSLASSSCSTDNTANNGEDLLQYSRRRVNNRHSSNDWLHNILSIPKSTVLKEIRNPVLSIASFSTIISILHKILSTSSNASLVNFASKMSVGTQMHSLMISSLGLLLVLLVYQYCLGIKVKHYMVAIF